MVTQPVALLWRGFISCKSTMAEIHGLSPIDWQIDWLFYLLKKEDIITRKKRKIYFLKNDFGSIYWWQKKSQAGFESETFTMKITTDSQKASMQMKSKRAHWTRRAASLRNPREHNFRQRANILTRLSAGPFCFKWICQNSIDWKREREGEKKHHYSAESTRLRLKDFSSFKTTWSLANDDPGPVWTGLITFLWQHMGYYTAKCEWRRWIFNAVRQNKRLSGFREQKIWWKYC